MSSQGHSLRAVYRIHAGQSKNKPEEDHHRIPVKAPGAEQGDQRQRREHQRETSGQGRDTGPLL